MVTADNSKLTITLKRNAMQTQLLFTIDIIADGRVPSQGSQSIRYGRLTLNDAATVLLAVQAIDGIRQISLVGVPQQDNNNKQIKSNDNSQTIKQ
jgi:hypothetical protein